MPRIPKSPPAVIATARRLALLGSALLAGACARYPHLEECGCGTGSPLELDARLPFDLGAGEPEIARFYTYPFDEQDPPWRYSLGWDVLDGCMSSAAPGLPAPGRSFNILTFAQAMANSIARQGDEITIQDLLRAGAVPETLRPAGPVRASYYLGALLRCAEQGRLIARVHV